MISGNSTSNWFRFDLSIINGTTCGYEVLPSPLYKSCKECCYGANINCGLFMLMDSQSSEVEVPAKDNVGSYMNRHEFDVVSIFSVGIDVPFVLSRT